MKLLYGGFDTVDVALQGAFPEATIQQLKSAREAAAERQDAVLVKVGPGAVPMFVEASGLRGGYAIRADTGPLGEVLAFKANSDPHEWNGFVSIRAASLAAYGYKAARARVFERLALAGFYIGGHSVNRIDYAADFLAPHFELRQDGFVAHPRAKLRTYWSAESVHDPNHPSAVFAGRRLESVTIGKMPGRQIIVYDKRRAAIAQQKLFWFKVWNIDRADAAANIWRVEIRAGKKELKERYGIRTFADVDCMIGDVMRHALDEVRYVATSQGDSNVTRQLIDPLWQATIDHVERGLFDFRSGVMPFQIIEVERQIAIARYAALVRGNIAGLAAAEGLDDEEIETELRDRVQKLLIEAINDPDQKFHQSMGRARERMHFITLK